MTLSPKALAAAIDMYHGASLAEAIDRVEIDSRTAVKRELHAQGMTYAFGLSRRGRELIAEYLRLKRLEDKGRQP